jgi:hypothetical protein
LELALKTKSKAIREALAAGDHIAAKSLRICGKAEKPTCRRPKSATRKPGLVTNFVLPLWVALRIIDWVISGRAIGGYGARNLRTEAFGAIVRPAEASE